MITTVIHTNKKQAAEIIASEIANLIEKRSSMSLHTVLGLATGSTPLELYTELIKLHKFKNLSFRSVITYNLDEYEGLSPEHPQSYYQYMYDNLFRHIDILPQNIKMLNGKSKDPIKHCSEFEVSISKTGGIDLQILGIGRSGHIGFNEPMSPLDSRTRRVILDETTRCDNSIYFDDISDVPHSALTMGIATILEARRIELMAFGNSKSQSVWRAIHETPTPMCPASWLQLHPKCTFHLDTDSANLL